MQCIAVKADEGDSAAATSWRAPPILPRTALRQLHMVVQQLSALAGDKQLEEGFPQMFTSCATERELHSGSTLPTGRELQPPVLGANAIQISHNNFVIQSGKRTSQEEQI